MSLLKNNSSPFKGKLLGLLFPHDILRPRGLPMSQLTACNVPQSINVANFAEDSFQNCNKRVMR